MSYAKDHAGAVEDIQEAGASITFSHTTPGEYDPVTGLNGAPTTVTVAGYAVQVKADSASDLQRFAALGLTLVTARVLLFAPATFGAMPESGYTTSWGGDTVTVRHVQAIAPGGTAIMGRVTVSR